MQGRGCQQAADVSEGVEAVAALKWWGTLPEGMLKDLSFGVIRAIMKARSAAEVLDAGKTWLYVSQNLVAAEPWPPFATFSSVCPLWADFQGGIRTVHVAESTEKSWAAWPSKRTLSRLSKESFPAYSFQSRSRRPTGSRSNVEHARK